MADALATLLGDNKPPADLLVGDSLRDKLRDENYELIQRRDQLLDASTRIPPITDDDVAGKVSDYIKQLSALVKASETNRTGAKEPYLEGGRNVDGFFKAITDPVEKVKTDTQRKLTTYLREKEEAARRARQEEERLAREAAEAARKEAERLAADAADAAGLDSAIGAEKAAEAAQADLVKAERASDVKPAELSRTRGEYGSMSSLRTQWVFDEVNRDEIDLETLRFHLPSDGIEKAIRSFIKAGGRELKGTRIFETTAAVVR